MTALPVMLWVEGRLCVVVGGGRVALRRVRALLEADAAVLVVAPAVDQEIVELGVAIRQRPYRTRDLDGAYLVVIATDDPHVNRRVAADARQAAVLVNNAHEPRQGDLVIPAHARHGPVTIAVSTSGISASAAASIRRDLSRHLDPHWAVLLQVVAAYRDQAMKLIAQPQPRTETLRQMASPTAMEKLKMGGEAELHRYCQQVLASATEARSGREREPNYPDPG